MKLHELVGEVARAAAKCEAVADDVRELKGQVETLKRVVWMGLGAVAVLQALLSFSNGQVNEHDKPTAAHIARDPTTSLRAFPVPAVTDAD